jgi:hypothetical protein
MSLPSPSDIYDRTIVANRGSDVPFGLTWPDSSGDPADLFGWTVRLMDVSAALEGRVTVAISDAANGRVTGRIEWNDSLAANTPYQFRIQISLGSEDQSTQVIGVVYQ